MYPQKTWKVKNTYFEVLKKLTESLSNLFILLLLFFGIQKLYKYFFCPSKVCSSLILLYRQILGWSASDGVLVLCRSINTDIESNADAASYGNLGQITSLPAIALTLFKCCAHVEIKITLFRMSISPYVNVTQKSVDESNSAFWFPPWSYCCSSSATAYDIIYNAGKVRALHSTIYNTRYAIS